MFNLLYSETEASLHVPESPVFGVRAALIQLVRLVTKHELPRRLLEFDSQVCSAVVYGEKLIVCG